jgi:NAD(P)H-flavin reductase
MPQGFRLWMSMVKSCMTDLLTSQSPLQQDSSEWIPKPWVVLSRRQESADTVTLEIVLKSGELPLVKPGQFHMMYVFGVGEIPISFSAIKEASVEHTVRNVGPVSRALFNLKPKSEVGIRGPYGSHWDTDICHDRDVLIIAGGVGLAPLKPLVEFIVNHRAQYRNVHVLYGARNPESVLFEAQSSEWSKHINFLLTVDMADDNWKRRVGVVPSLIDYVDFEPDRTTAFVCGPEIMMNYAIGRLTDYGVSSANIYLTMERNMKCAIGFCGHCQYGGSFMCKQGPVYSYESIKSLFRLDEV